MSALIQYFNKNKEIHFGVCLLDSKKSDIETKLSPWCSEIFLLNANCGFPYQQLFKTIKLFRPNIVHCHVYANLLLCILVARASGVPRIVTTLHMPLYPWHWYHRLAWRLAVRMSHVVVGVSNDVLGSIGTQEDRSRYWVVPCPLAYDVRKAKSRNFSARPDEVWTVCGVGRLSKEKDWPTLIKAFALFHAGLGNVCRLVIYGEGPDRPALQSLIDKLGIGPAVELPGSVVRAELPNSLSSANLFILPSRFEGFGIAAIEAMALGIPTITADYGASLDYIEHGITGHRFTTGDVQALADLLAWHYNEQEVSHSLGKRGRIFVVERFSEANTLEKYSCIYELPMLN